MIIGTLLFNDLQIEEGFRGDIYDDANGETIKPGYTIIGNPTTGYGFAFNKNPLTKSQAQPILREKCWDIESWCIKNLPYWENLSGYRQFAVACIVYQMGGDNWLCFTKANYYLKQGDYDSAATEILDSKYHSQTPARAARMASIIRNDEISTA